MRVLIFDPHAIGGSIMTAAEQVGWDLSLAKTAGQASDLIRTTQFNLAFVCSNGAKQQICELIQDVARSAPKGAIPVVLGTSNGVPQDFAAKAFDSGAICELTLPGAPSKIIALAAALARFSEGIDQQDLRIGGLELDLSRGEFRCETGTLDLTSLEFRLLELLFLRRDRLVTRTNIMDHLYDGLDDPVEKIVDVAICRLRKKLANSEGVTAKIETVWGQGYRVPNQQDSSTALPVFRRADRSDRSGGYRTHINRPRHFRNEGRSVLAS